MRVRTATGADAAAIAGLMEQLGYAAEADLFADKLSVLGRSADDAVLMAVKGERVISCLSAHAHELFHASGRLGRITTLIIDADAGGQGAGRALIEAATRDFEDRGCIRVEVTSGDHRPSAHAFNQSVGFVVDERRFVRKLEPR